MTDTPPAVPTIAAHYRAYLRAKTKLSPEITLKNGQTVLAIDHDEIILRLIFARRKAKWSLRHIEVSQDGNEVSFAPRDLAKAIAILLGRELPAPTQSAVSGRSGPRTDAALREKRNTVIRV